MTWDGFYVCADTCWQPRHPQDFVEGRADDQTVEIVRGNIQQTMGTTTLSATSQKSATTVTLTSVSKVADRDAIAIDLDSGETYWTYVDGTPTALGVVTLGSYLPGKATAGNTVYLPSINSETFITSTSLTATGL
jgi:hypothetical protein